MKHSELSLRWGKLVTERGCKKTAMIGPSALELADSLLLAVRVAKNYYGRNNRRAAMELSTALALIGTMLAEMGDEYDNTAINMISDRLTVLSDKLGIVAKSLSDRV